VTDGRRSSSYTREKNKPHNAGGEANDVMMAAPTQARRDLKAPLSRSQRSNSLSTIFVVLGVLALVTIGGFLFSKSLQSTSDVSLQKAAESAAKKEEVAWKTNIEKPDDSKAKLRVEEKAATDEETLVISTKHGNLKVVMRPDLSPESVEYIRALVGSGKCKRCNFYRAEKPGILQGIMDEPALHAQVTKGKCPPEFHGAKQDCPPHDPECGCHGPIMVKGMVGWAGGDTGPDFFIDSYENPAKFWGNQHTVFGQIKDEESFAVIDKIYMLPVTNKGMTYLDEKIQFTLAFQ